MIEEMYHHCPDAKRLNYNTFGELRDYPADIGLGENDVFMQSCSSLDHGNRLYQRAAGQRKRPPSSRFAFLGDSA